MRKASHLRGFFFAVILLLQIKMNKKVVIIGGGAAGYFAAINIAEKLDKTDVLILEKSNQVLAKVKVSGGGRCNVTHACFDPKELTENYPRGEKELMGPFHQFYTADIISWFEERGLGLKVEEDGRMFPESNTSQTIIDCFLTEAEQKGVELWKKAEVIEIEKKDLFHIKLKDGREVKAEKLIIACGGSGKEAHYDFIHQMGHRIVKPIPSLFTFNMKGHESNQLMGIAQDATVRLKDSNYEEYGPVLFTHWGMSGPAILKLSSKAAKLLHDLQYQFDFEIEWMSNSEEWLQEQRKNSGNKQIYATKFQAFTKRFWFYLLKRAHIPENLNWADLNKSQLEKLQAVLSNDSYRANGKTTFKEEFVTCGGVDLKEVDMRTMESKLVKDLYFCGEVLNIDALTGGFNFQAAWTTAWLISTTFDKTI